MKITLKTLDGTIKLIELATIPTVGEMRIHISHALDINWDEITVTNILDKRNKVIGSIFLDDPGEVNFKEFLGTLNNNCDLELDELTFFIINNMRIDRLRPIIVKGELELEKQTLPTLIFAECHYDTITKDILSKLIPVLKNMGYSCYYNEMGESQTLEDRIDHIRELEKLMITLQNKIKSEHNEDIDFSSTNALSHPFLRKVMDDKQLFDFMRFISHKYFLYAIRRNQISYKGIDLEMSEIKKTPTGDVSEESMEIRDEKMANAFLNASENVFSSVGLLHVLGIQNHILKSISLDSIKKYKFFYLYTHQSDRIQQYIQKTSFPLGLSPIDATQNKEDVIIKTILTQIVPLDQDMKLSAVNSLR
jgi:hypothetical protein